jgi:hypothetical protein
MTLTPHRRQLRHTVLGPCLLAILALAQAGCDDKKSPSMPTEPNGGPGNGAATAFSVVIINVPNQPLDLGESVTLRADSQFADGSHQTCTDRAIWTSSNPAAADFIGPTLSVTGPGPVTVKATCDGASSSNVTIPIEIRARAISGVVTDAASHAGIAGAFVRVIVDGVEGVEVTSGAGGGFNIPISGTPASLAVDARAVGYGTVHRQPINAAAVGHVLINVSLQHD